MDITLNNLLNYLNNDEIIEDKIKTLEKNVTENFNKINKFNDIFKDYVIRYGVANKDNSFLFTILLLLDEEFIFFSEENQNEYINTLKKRIYFEVTEKNLMKKIKLSKNGWNKKNILKLLKDNIINNNYIYYIASYFNINIFIIDIEKNKIFPFYNDEKFIKYKTNLIISYYNNIYEPIMYQDQDREFSYNSNILLNILNSDILEIPIVGFSKKINTKIFEINNTIDIDKEDTDNIVDIVKNNNEENKEENDIIISTNVSNNEPIYKIDDIDIQLELNTISEDYNTENNFIENKYSTYTIEELTKKYKKPELINICKNLNIPYSNKNKLQLAKEILQKK